MCMTHGHTLKVLKGGEFGGKGVPTLADSLSAAAGLRVTTAKGMRLLSWGVSLSL